MFTYVEENYLKAIFHLSSQGEKSVSTNAIALELNTTPASVSDMIRKLSKKKALYYEKYKGVNVSPKGKEIALRVIRKHRLWEVFLVQKLKFKWDEVHDIAEQLEHIKSPILIKRLDDFLGFPKYDPHGDPIPDEDGKFHDLKKQPLSQSLVGAKGAVIGVEDSSSSFLKYLDKVGISIGTELTIVDKNDFDGSLDVEFDGKTITVSPIASENISIVVE